VMVGTSPLLGSLLLIAAGVYQWTPLKQACLTHCRSPLLFLLTCWRDGSAGAILMGLRHGAYCVGCCWLLMAVLFAVGVMNLAWIAALSVFVLLEKIIPRGFWAAKVAGLFLMALGGWMALSGGARPGVRAMHWEIDLTFQCSGLICSASQMKSGLLLRLSWVPYTGFLLLWKAHEYGKSRAQMDW